MSLRRILIIGLVLCLGRAVPALAVDSDGDGLDDAWEGANFGNLQQTASGDPDGDNLSNANEQAAGTDPLAADTDGDGLSDFVELFPAPGKPQTQPTLADTDGDFLSDGDEVTKYLTNPTLKDTDGDALPDNLELAISNTDPRKADTDGGFADDGQEVLVDHTDPGKPGDDLVDTDGDKLSDWHEINTWFTDPTQTDSDGDTLSDGDEVKKYNSNPAKLDTDGDALDDAAEITAITDPQKPDTDGDGLADGPEVLVHKTSPLLTDSDWDSLSDADEIATFQTNPLLADSDGGGVYDAVEISDGTNPLSPADDVGADPDGDGLSSNYEVNVSLTSPTLADTDGDFADDGQEWFALSNHIVTLPLDADSDDDGLLDGKELGVIEPIVENFLVVGQGVVGGTNPMAFSTDDDGMGDGQELGVAAAPLSLNATVDTASPPFLPDLAPTETTDPQSGDSDGDGLADSVEDANGNGAWEPGLGETNPAAKDTDGDGLDDGFEVKYADDANGSEGKPLDALDPADGAGDNDGDGLSNIQEYKSLWIDDAGVVLANATNPRQKDTDKDGSSDKVEAISVYQAATPTGSNPTNPDSDADGLLDGAEDKNHNGVTDPTESNPRKPDSDGDGLPDAKEDKNANGVWDKAAGETNAAGVDSDGDGVNDGLEVKLFGSNPLAKDSDGDGLLDGLETGKVADADPGTTTDPTLPDSDGDGLYDGIEDANHNGKQDAKETSPQKADSDNDGLGDGLEAGKGLDADPSTKTNPLLKDTDGDGLNDGTEDKNKNGKQDADLTLFTGESDPTLDDSDGGGVQDGKEVLVDLTNPLDPTDDANGDNDGDGVKNKVETKLGLDPKNPDTDGDTISDGQEANNGLLGKVVDTDGDGTMDALDADSDGDGIADSVEAGDGDWQTPAVDTDGDGAADFRDLDCDGDGLNDADEPLYGTSRMKADSDGDGLGDGAEVHAHTGPLDPDSDDDGVLDGDDGVADLDGDGLIGALDPDADNDGILDGTEAGKTVATLGPGTLLSAGAFRPDLDPATQTNPQKADTDGDGQRDGAEDVNHNGRVDDGERNPFVGGETLYLGDQDADGVPDTEEGVLGTSRNDADSDDDGVPDGVEWNMSCDSDGDGASNAADADSDNDGLADGLERGAGSPVAATNLLAYCFLGDVDPTSTTSPLLADSDGDGQRDGLEDQNGNGQVDPGEGDPNAALTQTIVVDQDGDGLADAEEARAGSDPHDQDSDDDGVIDGLEANALYDFEHDGLPGVLAPDSDDDGLADGTEAAIVNVTADTAKALGRFVADADTATHTLGLAADSDGDGQPDGWEDANLNGRVDAEEGDPLDPAIQSKAIDSDGDGLCDPLETTLHSRLHDADSDDAGVADGKECNPSLDVDGDGQPAVLDEDSDGDGLGDGLEIGLTSGTLAFPKDTDVQTGVFLPDQDPTHTTWPANSDTDRGGLPDGVEDFSRDGKVDIGETDPLIRADDGNIDGDLDGDSLDNKTELLIGTNPLRPDSDGDGMLDPTEVVDPTQPLDTDGDGLIDALDTDSENDGVPDAYESGLSPGNKTLPQKPVDSDRDGLPDFRDADSDNDSLPDGDEVFKWHTDARLADTDFGGLSDPVEVLETHTNPLDPRDDVEVLEYGGRLRGTTPLSCQAGTPARPGALLLLALPVIALLGLRRRRVLLLALLLAPGAATALTPLDMTSGRTNLDGAGILGLESAHQLDLYSLSAGVHTQYVWRPLVVGTETRVLRSLVEQRLQADAVLAARVWDDISLGVAVPVSLWQQGTLPSLYGPQSGPLDGATAIGDLVVAAKYVVLAERQYKLGVAGVVPVTVPLGDPNLYMGRPFVTVTPTAVVSTALGPWRITGNVGVRAQQTQSLFNLTDGPAVRMGAAASLNASVAQDSWVGKWVPDGWWLDASLVHETPLRTAFANATNERMEATLAVGWPLGDDLYGSLGSGFGIWPGFGVPAYRPFFSIRYAPQDKEKPPPPPKPVQSWGVTVPLPRAATPVQ